MLTGSSPLASAGRRVPAGAWVVDVEFLSVLALAVLSYCLLVLFPQGQGQASPGSLRPTAAAAASGEPAGAPPATDRG